MPKANGVALKDMLAVVAGKTAAFAIKTFGLGLASNLPGRIAEKMSPKVLSSLAAQAERGVIAVTGTNGKSTTSGLVASILQAESLKVVHNRQGANLVAGITASLVDAASFCGRVDADYCLFEIDEAALPLVAKATPISIVLVTNLFRDQLDRFGELDTTAKLIQSGIEINKSTAVLNADDPNVAQMVATCPRLFYGIRQLAVESTVKEELSELSYSPCCGVEYEYSRRFYGQLGHYSCPACGKARVEPQIIADQVNVGAVKSEFLLEYGEHKLKIELPLPGLFNVYNALAAAALCYAAGISAQAVQEGLCRYSTLFGRSERINLDDKTLLIQLIKNPAGASQALQAAAADKDGQLLIAINDNYADGRDVSWLWDAEFEQLKDKKGPFIVSGKRCYDMALRLKYAGIESGEIIVEPDLSGALDKALAELPSGKTLWLLPTYTCLLELQKIMKARGCKLSAT
ncbi:MAG: MurT ligase domain-containing protein [Candidatus Obscuribacterales bacterium]|nr:MurT ligase domain-containing protein [Candidatus Obscuribacterales bacterium]